MTERLGMRRWARRAAALHRELRALAPVNDADPRWWFVAGGAALPWRGSATYLASDADPNGDTFIGYRAGAPLLDGADATPPPADDVDAASVDAVARAYAARDALRALDGELPDQPLAVTISRGTAAAVLVPSALEVAAFAIGDACWCAPLDDAPAHRACLVDELAALLAGADGADATRLLQPPGAGAVPFVCITLGEEPIETARHGHRRAWLSNGVATGPWLGLSRTRDVATGDPLEIVSTCHLAIDGYGHARLAALLAEHRTASAPRLTGPAIPTPCPVTGAVALGIAWRELPRSPRLRAVPLAYALGQLLHAVAGRGPDELSPTFQIPVAPGAFDDPERKKRRVIPALASVRFADGVAEPYDRFAARVTEMLVREAQGDGLASLLLAAARSAPAPLAWKRRAVGGGTGTRRPGFLEPLAEVIGGRGCVSRIRMDTPLPAACAVSAPARVATAGDPLGGCVVTVVDDGERAAITLCGTGAAGTAGQAAALLDRLLARLPQLP